MTGRGTSGGAGTIVNAMATGRGAAFGLAFRVGATVRPARAWSVWSDERRLTRAQAELSLASARRVQKAAHVNEPWRIDVRSEIPPERGLKSSSAVSIAVIRAALQEVDTRWSAQRILNAVADAGLASGTSLTGAFDDAAACLLGGLVVTDNRRRRIVARSELPRGLQALVRIPRPRLATKSLQGTRFDSIAWVAQAAWDLARRGNPRDAMLLNSAAYAGILGHATDFTLDALAAGAWSAGLSGKGPAEIALGSPDVLARLRQRHRGARIVRLRRGGSR